jgi:hypothetical protein
MAVERYENSSRNAFATPVTSQVGAADRGRFCGSPAPPEVGAQLVHQRPLYSSDNATFALNRARESRVRHAPSEAAWTG